MGEEKGPDAVGEAVVGLDEFLTAQLQALEDPRNVHQVRERLFGQRWTESFDAEALPTGLLDRVRPQVDLAWAALSRYPWDLYGAQKALKAAVEQAKA
jgi:hypothetical protein